MNSELGHFGPRSGVKVARRITARGPRRALSFLLGLLLPEQRLTRRIPAVALIDHALLTLEKRLARGNAAVAFIYHAFGSGGDRRCDRSDERERSESGQQHGSNG